VGNYEPQTPDDPEGELYDLSIDESETTNIYDDYPKMVSKLQDRLEDIIRHDATSNEE
jgi:hypothetical protein